MSAKKKPIKMFKSWSFSRLQDYERCPRYAAWRHLEKLPVSTSKAMQRGIDVHTQAEHFILGKERKLPAALESLKRIYAKTRALYKKNKALFTLEQMWGHAIDWTPIDPKAWNDCWLRVKMDVVFITDRARVLNIDDHKTGKIKQETHRLQMLLYGTSALHRYPKIQEVRSRMLYVDHGKTEAHVLTRRELLTATEEWNERVRPMFADRRFAPRPGNYCTWCDYSKSKEGPCQY